MLGWVGCWLGGGDGGGVRSRQEGSTTGCRLWSSVLGCGVPVQARFASFRFAPIRGEPGATPIVLARVMLPSQAIGWPSAHLHGRQPRLAAQLHLFLLLWVQGFGFRVWGYGFRV